MFWRITDLTGHGLQVGQIGARVAPADSAGSFECAPARVAYFKLVPVTDAETRAFQSDEQVSDTSGCLLTMMPMVLTTNIV